MKKIMGAVLTLLISLVGFQPAFADTTEHGLGISPVRQEITLAAGTSYTGSVTVTNDTSQPLSVDMYAQAFRVADESYAYTFLDASPLNQWLHFTEPTFTLQPHASQVVTYTVGVPANATPGGKYFSLFAATTNPTDDRGIAVSERVGSLLYVTIPGDVSHKGKLLGLQIPLVAFSTINWSEKVNNTGANYFTSTYKVSLQTAWGKEVSSQSGSSLLISSSVRLLSGTLTPPRWLGVYKVSAQFSLGDSGNQTDSRWFVYLPPPQLFLLFAIIAGVIGFIVDRYYRRRKNNKKAD